MAIWSAVIDELAKTISISRPFAVTSENWGVLSELKVALHSYLRTPDGLWDPDLNAPTPSDHYGQLSAALALRILDEPNQGSWRQPLDVWLNTDRDQLGHLPFNRFLLLLLRDILTAEHDSPHKDLALIEQGLQRCRLKRDYPSNNWSLLAQLCRLIDAGPATRSYETERFCTLIDRWTTPAGGFVDFPARPHGIGATPMAYHHKALFLALVAAWFDDCPALRSRITRLLRWIWLCWDGDAIIAAYGRSTHSLFADGCLLAALILLGFDNETGEDAGGVAAMAHGLHRRLLAQKRPDGFYWLNPAGPIAGASGWDSYMFLSVYNAWFAAIVAWALHRRATGELPQCLKSLNQWPANESDRLFSMHSGIQATISSDDSAGIIKLINASGLTLLISSRGQPPQVFSPKEVELRYSGGIPFHGRIGNRTLVPPASRVDLDKLIRFPALAGWTPVFRVGECIYGLSDFDTVEWCQTAKGGMRITLQGCPTALLRLPAKGLLNRAMAALDWRLLQGAWGRMDALRRERIDFIKAKLILFVPGDRPAISAYLSIDNLQDNQVFYLNPAGHSLMSDALPSRWVVGFRRSDDEHFTYRRISRPEMIDHIELPCAVANGLGCCLPGDQLSRGGHRFIIRLEW